MFTDLFWMQKAFELAVAAGDRGEVPVGAVIVDQNNQWVGQSGNLVLQMNDPTAHAEMMVIREAAKKINNYRLENTTLYVTLEPCSMCAGAMVHARIQRLVFATRDFKAGAAGSVYNLLNGFPLNHQIQIDEGFLQHECASLLSDFFKIKRKP